MKLCRGILGLLSEFEVCNRYTYINDLRRTKGRHPTRQGSEVLLRMVSYVSNDYRLYE